MRVRSGDPQTAVIDADLEEPLLEDWLLGSFQLIVRGNRIGDPEDVVTLRAVLAWWRQFVTLSAWHVVPRGRPGSSHLNLRWRRR